MAVERLDHQTHILAYNPEISLMPVDKVYKAMQTDAEGL